MRIIGDPGSCHCGSIDKAFALIDVAIDAGLDAVKFQLFQNTGVNIPLPYEWFANLVQYGETHNIEVFASIFDATAYNMCTKLCKTVKFSYNSPMKDWITTAKRDFKEVIVSGDIMNEPDNEVTKLYCIPLYPVPYKIDFEGIFSRFDGFSDHTLGHLQTIKAIQRGAKVIEKHYRLDECDDIPDARFALKPKELREMVNKVKWTVQA